MNRETKTETIDRETPKGRPFAGNLDGDMKFMEYSRKRGKLYKGRGQTDRTETICT